MVTIKKLYLSVAVALILIPVVTVAEQILPADFRAMPVLIEVPLSDKIHSSYGTGVFLRNSNRLFLVTAAHCFFNPESTNWTELINTNAILSQCTTNPSVSDKTVITLNLAALLDKGALKRHPTHDVAVACIAMDRFDATNGTAWAPLAYAVYVQSNFGLRHWSTNSVSSLPDVDDGNELYITGFPVELLNSGVHVGVDFGAPLLRKGLVSQRNFHSGLLIIDSGVYGGNSGGPVVAIDHLAPGITGFRIVGLITKFAPAATRMFPQEGITNSVYVNSGYGVAEPMDFALELMRQF